MGRAAGMATIGVAWGYHPRDAARRGRGRRDHRRFRRARRRARPPRGAGVSWIQRRRFWKAAAVGAGGRGLRRPPRRPAAAHAGRGAARRADRGARRGDRARSGTRSRPRSAPSCCPSPAPSTSRSTGWRSTATPVVDAIADYGGSDLLCYRAAEPAGARRPPGRGLGPLAAVVGAHARRARWSR